MQLFTLDGQLRTSEVPPTLGSDAIDEYSTAGPAFLQMHSMCDL